jgi:16S rRNA (cytosine967-C5)-methyltransferase
MTRAPTPPNRVQDARTAPGARALAAEVLRRVDRDDAFLAAALHAELQSWPTLDPREASLATALAYGTLRTQGWLDDRLNAHAKRGVDGFPPKVRWHLRVAAYQLAFLTRVPASAAVNEAVRAAKREGGEPIARAVNAILRRVAKDLEGQPTPSFGEAVWASLPEAFRRRLPRAVCDALAGDDDPPPTGLRVRAGLDRAHVADAIAAERPAASVGLGAVSPLAVLVRRAGAIEGLTCVGDGRAVVQEEGSQVVGLAVGAEPGERVLDACAGRGHKTTLLAEAVGDGGRVDAADLHAKKLRVAEEEARALGYELGLAAAVDWSVGAGPFAGAAYDRVLVDAPCSGSGTFVRRPEVARRFTEAKLAELVALQRAIAQRCASLVRPGGLLVVATCSLFPEEGAELAASLRETLGFAPADLALLRTHCATLSPTEHGTEGYSLAAFRRPG